MDKNMFMQMKNIASNLLCFYLNVLSWLQGLYKQLTHTNKTK